ncbi:MAG: hypothetical protein V2J20_08475 [Wenzhouxiangella sp.]|jgi:hypothetical protein|nr:hypothetical protein [Wenzhouxiangella sp.]
MDHRRTDVLVTGVPRGGTTLAGALLDSLPDTVCLSEPPWQWHKSTGGQLDIGSDPTGEVFAKWLVGDFVDIRRRLLIGEEVLDRRRRDARPSTNYHPANSGSQPVSASDLSMRPVRGGELTTDFTLAIKHNGPYLTALRPLLRLQHFKVIALVRHPVDVIHSWRSLNLPVSRGKMQDAARCWPEMAAVTDSGDVLKRQVLIYDLICERLQSFRDQISILRYEDVCAAPGLISAAVGAKDMPDKQLITKPSRQVDAEQSEIIASALNAYGSHYRHFYPDLGASG